MQEATVTYITDNPDLDVIISWADPGAEAVETSTDTATILATEEETTYTLAT